MMFRWVQVVWRLVTFAIEVRAATGGQQEWQAQSCAHHRIAHQAMTGLLSISML